MQPGPTAVGGNWTITSGEVVDQKQIGQLVYLRQRGTAAFAGDLVGTTSFDLRAFLRPDFSSSGLATEVFTGTIGGRSGTLLLLERVTGGADGSARIDAVALGGTGGLRGLHGQITCLQSLCTRVLRRNVLRFPVRLAAPGDPEIHYGTSGTSCGSSH